MQIRCVKYVHRLGDGRNRVTFEDCGPGGTTNYARLIGAIKIGRPLERHEVAHHRNGDCSDDRLENIEVLSQADHSRWHGLNPRAPVIAKTARYTAVTVRLPDDLRSMVKESAGANIRSMNSEMVHRLNASFKGWKQI